MPILLKNILDNVPEYAMFAGDIIANEVSHHQQIWV